MPPRRGGSTKNTERGSNGILKNHKASAAYRPSAALASITASLPDLSLSAGSTPPEEELVDPVATPQGRSSGRRDFFRGYGQAVFNNVTGEVTPMSVKLFEIGDGAWSRITRLVAILNAPGMNEEKCRETVKPPSEWADLYKRFQKVVHVMAVCLPEITQPAMDGYTVAYLTPEDDIRCPEMPGWPTIDRMPHAERLKLLSTYCILPHPGTPQIMINIWQCVNAS